VPQTEPRAALPAVESARWLDEALGDPADPGTVLSYMRCAELERIGEFPTEICAELDRLGLPRHYVPVAYGGALAAYDEVFHLMRVLAGRDLTAAIAHGKTFLGAASVWVAGAPDQRVALAREILSGAPVSWGLTERDHGSDLLAGEVTAVATPDGYRIDGEKWLVNNATHGRFVCVLARTDPKGGPRGFSLLLADKHALDPDRFRCLPKVPTHGIRAADISGIAFDQATVPPGALVGPVGGGIEIVLKSFQLTRTAAGALSLGAADHAFGLTVDFLGDRVMYRRRLLDLPKVRADLGEAYGLLFAAETLGWYGCRAIHTQPEEMSVLSSVTKYLVPTFVDEILGRLGDLLGIRAYLADYADGRFARLERDHRIVGIFDGSTFVNQNLLINQFPALARGYRRGDPAAGAAVGLAAALAQPLPPADLGRLSLAARSCGLTSALASAVAEVGATSDAPTAVAALAAQLLVATDAVHEEMAGLSHSARAVPPEAFDLAHRYALCVAGAASLQVWLRNRSVPPFAGSTLWKDARWLRAALVSIVDRLPGRRLDRSTVYTELVDAVLVDAPDGRASLIPTRSAGAAR
jgi:alkylation response protein AidB-like acyl-CoA dehydrogenase